MLGVVLGTVQNSARRANRSDPITRLVRGVITQPKLAVSNGLDSVSFAFGGLFNGRQYQEEIEHLRSEVKAASLYNERVDILLTEIDQLRKLQNLPSYNENLRIAGRITGYYPLENRATLSIGSKQQVKAGLPVVCGDGLVGIVQTVDTDESQVQLVTSPSQKIGVSVLGPKPSDGLLHGQSLDRLIVELVDIEVEVPTGALVVTSGHSVKIPAGIPVGRVSQVTSNPEFGVKTVQVFPDVQMNRVREVYVLR